MAKNRSKRRRRRRRTTALHALGNTTYTYTHNCGNIIIVILAALTRGLPSSEASALLSSPRHARSALRTSSAEWPELACRRCRMSCTGGCCMSCASALPMSPLVCRSASIAKKTGAPMLINRSILARCASARRRRRRRRRRRLSAQSGQQHNTLST